MKAILAGFGLAAILAGCVPMPPPQGMAPAPPAQAAKAEAVGPAAPDEAEPKAMPPTDVRQMKCATLNSASDDDKAYASTFLLGYRSAMVHSHVLDTKQIDAVVQAAVAECATKPEASAYKVFAVAQIKAAALEHPPAHHLHRKLPVTPAAAPATTPAEPTLSPPLQYVPAPATPMDTPPGEKLPGEKASGAAPVTPPSTAEAPAKPLSPGEASASSSPPAEQPATQSKPAEAPPPAAAPSTEGSKP